MSEFHDPRGSPRLSRRTAIRWMLGAGAGALLVRARVLRAGLALGAQARGYGTDPALLRQYKPGEAWPLTLTPEQRRLAAALADLIIPADELSPSASSVGVVDFIDEWVSAPYPDFVADGRKVADGLAWIEAQARLRHGVGFAGASDAQRASICDDLSHDPAPSAALREPSEFFLLFRNLTATGYYTSPEGVKDLGYVGNVPLARFDGPPPELIRKLGLEEEARSLG